MSICPAPNDEGSAASDGTQIRVVRIDRPGLRVGNKTSEKSCQIGRSGNRQRVPVVIIGLTQSTHTTETSVQRAAKTAV